MATGHRLTIRSIDPDPRIGALVVGAAHLGLPPVGRLDIADVVFVDGDLDEAALKELESVLVDPLLQHGSWSIPTSRAIEVTTLAGVTNSDVEAVLHAATTIGVDVQARRHRPPDRVRRHRRRCRPSTSSSTVWSPTPSSNGGRTARSTSDPRPSTRPRARADVIAVRGLDDDGLAAIDRSRSLSLDPAELRVIRDHFESLGRDPTDLELETLAQTWSEHCAHKTFRAAIELRDR